MINYLSKVFALSLMVIACLTSTAAIAFPEIPFCPLGGPPGWANRIFGDRYDNYPPPPYYYNQPYWQSYPQYSPVYPGAYAYGWQTPPADMWRE